MFCIKREINSEVVATSLKDVNNFCPNKVRVFIFQGRNPPQAIFAFGKQFKTLFT